MQKFETAAPIAAVIEVPAGLIQVIAADRSDTTVEVVPAKASASRDVKAAEQTAVEFEDGVLRVKTTLQGDQILGPSATLDAGTGHGRITNALKNTEGAAAALTIRATSGHGDITARSL